MSADPYRYFRIEARELLEALQRAALDLERDPTRRDGVAALLRAAHTLKGAARVVRLPAIAEKAHAMEELAAPLRVAGAPFDADAARRLLALVDEAAAFTAAIPDPPTEGRAVLTSTVERERAWRVEAAELDALLASMARTDDDARRVARAADSADALARSAAALAEAR
ncbi:MAG TPA: Hpt domain-containing protein, partial [Planctomycetota bacterium]|nr:Hpt domain-containing protein [Planctomycetota bacterium]